MKWSYVVLIKFETKYFFTAEKFKTSNVKILLYIYGTADRHHSLPFSGFHNDEYPGYYDVSSI